MNDIMKTVWIQERIDKLKVLITNFKLKIIIQLELKIFKFLNAKIKLEVQNLKLFSIKPWHGKDDSLPCVGAVYIYVYRSQLGENKLARKDYFKMYPYFLS